jgi:hypothetical protein
MKFSDALVTAGSCALALGAASFAGYMVTYGPPAQHADFALADLAADRVNVSRGERTNAVADPIITGTAPSDDSTNAEVMPPQGFFSRARRFDYRLERVAGGIAYVSISNGMESFTAPVRQGALVPGIGFAREIARRENRWVVVTGRLEITEDGISVAR